jgi:hypothetical protein
VGKLLCGFFFKIVFQVREGGNKGGTYVGVEDEKTLPSIYSAAAMIAGYKGKAE